MRDFLRTGVLAGLSASLIVGLIETGVAIAAVRSSGAPFYGLLLAPFFYWAVLLPIGASIGAVLGLWLWCWCDGNIIELRDRAISVVSHFREGSLTVLGWFWGALLMLGGICAIGTLLSSYFHEIFQNEALAGLLLTFIICLAGVFWFALVRRGMRAVGVLVVKRRSGRLGSRLSSVNLAIVSGVFLATILVVGAYVWSSLLNDIGIPLLLWVSSLPLVLLATFVAAVALAPRWRTRARIGVWLSALPICGLVIAAGLGEIEAVRQVALVSETPAAEIVTLFRALGDVDGDGASNLFGGADCAPFDSTIGPYAKEIPGNGIDDNCVGGDSVYSATDHDHELMNTRVFSPTPRDFPKRPNLVLITVDALRADHMGMYGYKRNTTPRIDHHAKKAVVFGRAYSQGTGTISSMPSIFTGKFTYQLKYSNDRMPPAVSPREITLAEHFKSAGYTTLGLTQLFYMLKGNWNLLQGFDHVDKTLAHGKPKSSGRISSPETLEIALDLSKRGRRSGKPYFLWVHFYDVHSKYKNHPEQKSFGERAVDKYDGEVLFTDRYVGELLDELLGPEQPPTMVVLAADHGDGFKSDRGRNNHAYGLFNELLHVPLIVWAPGAEPRRVDTPVGNVDIAPTLLNAAELKRPYLRGHSLFPYIYDGYRNPDRLIFSAKTFGRGNRKRYRKSATGMRWKMIRWITEKKEFLFDLKKDPKEKRNVIGKHQKVADKLRKQIDLFLERNAIDTLDLEQGYGK